MDYEKAYKDALRRASGFRTPECRDVAEYIFPELNESEGELKWLTKYIEEEAYSLSMDIRDEEDRIKLKKLQKSLTWLKKQKKEEPQIYETRDGEVVIYSENEGYKVVEESEDERIRKALLEYFGEECDTATINGIYCYKIYDWLEKQKPVEWRIEDGMIFNELFDFLINKKAVLQRDCNIYAHWLKSLKQRMEE